MSLLPSPPESSGRYIATERLGEGGTAEVWRAWDRHSERWCALKVLFERYAMKKSSRRRFIDEGETVIRLNHRNIIEAWDLVEDATQPFLVMEIAEGGSLRDWVERHGKMAPRVAVDAAIQISKGIGAAHRIGVVHRDIKPHNILLSRRGLCKVTDFGIAQLVRRDGTTDVPDWTKTHHGVAGTRGYMAPEQLEDGLAADARTDIYGIGATLFTLLTGRVDTNLFAVEQDPGLMQGIPGTLIPVVVKATRFKPDDRYPTVQDLARALFEVRDLLPPTPDTAPRLAPDLPPEPPGPYAGSRFTDPPSGGSLSDPPSPPAPPTALAKATVDPSTSAREHTPRPRPSLILRQPRTPSTRGASPSSEPQRTRPLVVVAALVGMLACLLTYDKVQVSVAEGHCVNAHRELLEGAMRTSEAVEAVESPRAGQYLRTLLSARDPRTSILAARSYVDALEHEAPDDTAVRYAVTQVTRKVERVDDTLQRWAARSRFPGIAVTLGLEGRPPAPPTPEERLP